jgi:anti-sigma B factor antagonist
VNIERLDRGYEAVLRLTGRFDAHQTTPFQTVFRAISGDVCIDMAGVGFIDSSGLAALVSSFRQCRERGARLRIVNLQDPVRLILEITRLHEVLPIEGREAVV